MIAEDAISRVREQADLLALVRESVRLEKAGRSYRGLCPFHQEKTPSFFVHPERGYYYCFGCHAHGDAISFLQRIEGLDFTEAVRELAERTGVQLDEYSSWEQRLEQAERRRRQQELYQVGEIAAAFYEAMLREHPLAGLAWAELQRRGLVPASATDGISDALQAFRVGYAPYGWDALAQHLRKLGASHQAAETVGLLVPRRSGPGHYDRFRHRLMFAVLDLHGRVVAMSGRVLPEPTEAELEQAGVQVGSRPPAEAGATAKYMNSPESPVYRKREVLFGLYQARQAIRETGEAILVEGNFDVLSLYARGIRNAVAPLGTSLTVEQARLLRRLTSNVTLLFDADRAGHKAVLRARVSCREAGLVVRVACLPEGRDPDEVVREAGPESIRQVLSRARGLMEYLIETGLEAVRSAPDLLTRADRIHELERLISSEADPAARALAQDYADRLVRELGLGNPATLMALARSLRSRVDVPCPGRPAVRPVSPSQARTPDRSEELPLRILGSLLDYPELLGIEEVVSGLAVVEGDVAAAIAAVHDAWQKAGREATEAQARRFRERVLARVPGAIHAFAAARLAAPEHDTIERAKQELLENVRKLSRLRLAPEKPELVSRLRRAASTGNLAEEEALLFAHQARLVSELKRVLDKQER